MKLLILLSIALSLLSGECYADGDCPSRPATGQEQKSYSSVHAAVADAIPPAPREWLMQDASDVKRGELMPDCPGGLKDAPHRYSFIFRYKYDPAVRDRKMTSAVSDAVKGSPEQQARMAELNKAHEDLMEARKQARRSGDASSVERIKDQIRKINDEQNQLNEEIIQNYTRKVQSGEMAKEMSVNAQAQEEAQVTFFVNADRAWVPDTAVPVTIPGVPYAYWRPNDGGSFLMLLGAWDPTPPTFRFTLSKATLITKPQSMMIEIRANRQRAESLAREMKWSLLTAQLK